MDQPIVVDHFAADRRSLRVALVTETFPPEVNGVARTMARIVDGLHARHHDIQLVRPRQDIEPQRDPAERFQQVLTLGLPVPRYPNLRMGLPAKRALTRLWATRRPDVVHIATEGPLGWSALRAAIHMKLPVCSDFRTNFHAYSQHYGVGWLKSPIVAYLRGFHNRTGCTMVPTDALQRDLERLGFRRLVVVTRGVDARLFSPARRSASLRAQWGVNEHDLVVACVGRLAAEKNLSVLVNAFEAVVAEQPRARLLLVGDGPMKGHLQALCPRAIFAGQRTGEDLAAHYASADLFVFPSLTETFGNVTTEAMASGLPVVAFDCAGAAQLIESGHNGALAAQGDSAMLIRQAVSLANDPPLRHLLGERARLTACAQDWDSVVARFEGVLEKVISAGADVVPAKGAQPALG